MTSTLPARSDVLQEHTWNTEHIYASLDHWEADYQAVEQELPGLTEFRGRLSESSATLLRWLQTTEHLDITLERLVMYPRRLFDTDTTNQANAALLDRARGLATRFETVTSFAKPELLAIDPARIEQFMAEEPALQVYQHFFDNLQRQREHVCSAETEDVLAQLGDTLETARSTYHVLSNGELAFEDATDSDGQRHRVSRGTIDRLLYSHDRTLRKTAWEAHADAFLRVKNTLASLLAGYVKANVARARIRNYPDARSAALAEPNVPIAVYDNVMDACNRHLPLWNRYWELRRRALGLEKLEICDILAPLSRPIDVAYPRAVEWICTGMAPLGEEYVRVLRSGLTDERWVDIYPNKGKRSGAYSSHIYTTHPFILMNYNDTILGMSSLAHEGGHAMHAYLTNAHQPFAYSHYSLFVAEVASNFNQALTRAHLLQQHPERDIQLAIIDETMRNFHRYLFLMPILSQFEQHIHEQVEQNQALTADSMSASLLGIFRGGYGPAVSIDEPRAGITWAQFTQLYRNFYVYQYASGIAAANALAAQVLTGDEEAVQRYLTFLKAGSSLYPLDALKLAGVDMTSPEPMDRAFSVLETFVDRLEQLLEQS